MVGAILAGLEVLGGIALQMKRGEFVSIPGPSGAGKSTLFRLLAGEVAHDSGEIRFDGATLGDGRPLAFMPQRDALMPWRRIIETPRSASKCRTPVATPRAKVAPLCRVRPPWLRATISRSALGRHATTRCSIVHRGAGSGHAAARRANHLEGRLHREVPGIAEARSLSGRSKNMRA